MKNLLCIAMLLIGISSVSQAQVLDYYISNASSTDTWDFGMDDAGPFPTVYELNITPFSLRTGSIPFLFAFPLQWKAQDSNGCGIYQNVTGPTGVVIAPTSCFGTNATYQVGTIIPFVYYYFKLELP